MKAWRESSWWNITCCVWGELHLSTVLPKLNLACDTLSSWLPGGKHVGETARKIYIWFSLSQKLVSVQKLEGEWTQKSIAFPPLKKLSMFFSLQFPCLFLHLLPLSPQPRHYLFNTLIHQKFGKKAQSLHEPHIRLPLLWASYLGLYISYNQCTLCSTMNNTLFLLYC